MTPCRHLKAPAKRRQGAGNCKVQAIARCRQLHLCNWCKVQALQRGLGPPGCAEPVRCASLKSCKLYIVAAMTAVHATEMKGCELYIVAAMTAVHTTEMKGCELYIVAAMTAVAH